MNEIRTSDLAFTGTAAMLGQSGVTAQGVQNADFMAAFVEALKASGGGLTQSVTGGNNEFSAENILELFNANRQADLGKSIVKMLSGTENGSSAEAALSSLGILNGSIGTSKSIETLLGDSKISEFLGIENDDNDDGLSGEQLMMMSMLSGGSLGGFDYSAIFSQDSSSDAMNGFLGQGGMDAVQALSGTDLTATMLKGLFDNGSENDDFDSEPIPLDSVIPFNALRQLSKAQKSESQTTEAADVTDVLKTAVEKGEVKVERASDDGEKLVGEASFANAVREAKKNVASTESDVIKAEAAAVQTVRTTDAKEIQVAEAEIPDEQSESREVLRQTVEQVYDRIRTANDRESFSIRLKPEGLGEVLVKLAKTGGGIVLDMAASSAKTAAMLNQQIAQLEQALAQYNPQVNTVTVEAGQNASGEFLQQEFSRQQYRGGEQQDGRQRRTASQTVEVQETAESVVRPADSSAINTYI